MAELEKAKPVSLENSWSVLSLSPVALTFERPALLQAKFGLQIGFQLTDPPLTVVRTQLFSRFRHSLARAERVNLFRRSDSRNLLLSAKLDGCGYAEIPLDG